MSKRCCICEPQKCWGTACHRWLCVDCESLTGEEWQAKQDEANRLFAETRSRR